MENNFLSIFGDYMDEPCRSLFGGCDVLKLEADLPGKQLEVTVRSDKFIEASRVHECQQMIAKAAELTLVRLQMKYLPTLLTADCFPSLVEELKTLSGVVNGFFDGAGAVLENGRLQVELKNGGRDLLLQAGVDRLLQKLIHDRFSQRVEVEFTGVTELQKDNYEVPPPITVPENVLNARPAPRPAPQQRPYGGGGGGGGYSRRNSGVKEPTSVTIDFTDLQFRRDGAMLLKGRKITQPPMSLSEVNVMSGTVVVWGDIFSAESKVTRDGSKVILTYSFTDYTSSNTMKIIDDVKNQERYESLKAGTTILVRGDVVDDKYDREISIKPYDLMTVSRIPKTDDAEEKRVELHCHTKMSAMDAVCDAEDVIKTAHRWGHKAVAITDHGVVQAFPDAMKAVDGIRKGGGEFKVLYGVEAYFVNDCATAVRGKDSRPFSDEFVVFDVETTGLSAVTERLTEIGAVLLSGGEVKDRFSIFVNPEKPIPPKITELTSITDEMVADAPKEDEALSLFLEFVGNRPLVAHNASFDMGFLRAAARRQGKTVDNTSIDTLVMARSLYPELKKHKLDMVAEHLQVGDFHHHRACDDAEVLSRIFLKMTEKLEKEKDIHTVDTINAAMSGGDPKQLKTYHQILLVRNQAGLKNLYQLVSMAHVKYYHYRPRIPKSELIKYREGLLVGSACEAGELFQAIVEGKSFGELCDIASFYDYLEIQPLGNNEFMLASGQAADRQQLIDFNKTVIAIGEKLGKPVVATCDAHFLNPEDAAFRRILLAGMKFKDADQQAPLYFRTTDEML
ncbi:MAG: PHP domain-containing protein, partial [Oscillospiraceae bacterium]|nr:PHP domain-containing protein [Oscillospiraceae bacterium]